MSWWLYVILFAFGYFVYKELSKGNDSPQNVDNNYRRRKTGRNTRNYTPDKEKESFIQSAQRQENLGNFDEASRLYLRAGQVFSAAKMMAMQGPRHANQAVELIQVNSPERAELITRNLANDFFYRLEKPAIASSLLRALGLVEEAQAVEVAAGLNTSQSYEAPMQTQSSSAAVSRSSSIEEMTPVDIETEEEDMSIASNGSEDISEESGEITNPDSYPNSMMLASTKLDQNCSVCKREIKSGDNFIFCLNCGKPGHYSHLGEMIKVTGKCPVCKQRLTPTMYDIS